MTTKQEITAEELMIGNILSYGGVQTTLTLVDFSDIYTSRGEDLRYYSGIPLTPEILDRCGFDYDTVTYCRNNILLAPSKNGFDVFFNGLTNGLVSHVTYLHELQNIVKSITCKNLTITP